MPTVRQYSRQVTTSALPSARRTLQSTPQVQIAQQSQRPSPEAYGAQFGQTLSNIGTAALGQQLQIREQEAAKADSAKLTQTRRMKQDWKLANIYDPKTGALAREGQDAIGLGDQVTTAFQKYTDEIRGTLTNDRQRAAFDQDTDEDHYQIAGVVLRHEAQQVDALHQKETTAVVNNATSLAMLSAGDDRQVFVQIGTARKATEEYLTTKGAGAEEIKSALDGVTSNIHVGVIKRLLADGLDLKAKDYFDAATDHNEIQGDQIAQLKKALGEGSTLGESQRQSDAIWKTHPDATLEELRNEAAKIPNAAVREDVESRLRVYHSQKKQDEADKRADFTRTAVEAAAQVRAHWDQFTTNTENKLDRGLPEDAMRRLPGWSDAPDNVRKDMLAYARALAKGDGRIETNWDAYYALKRQAANPEASKEFALEDLNRYRSVLGDTEYKELIGIQASLLKGKPDQAFDDFRTEKQIVDSTLEAAGIATNPKEGTPEAKRLNQIQRMLAERTQRLHPDRSKVTKPEIQQELDNLLIETTQPGMFYGVNAGPRAFEATVADIPAATLKVIRGALRLDGVQDTDENVLRLYREKLEYDHHKRKP